MLGAVPVSVDLELGVRELTHKQELIQIPAILGDTWEFHMARVKE